MQRDALIAACGDLNRFAGLQDQVQLLVDQELSNDAVAGRGWFVLPIDRKPHGFYLVSQDNEGQRRGREVLDGFLGPSVAVLDTVPLAPDDPLVLAGTPLCTHVRRVAASPPQLLARLEDALATVHSRSERMVVHRVTHLDLLRDLRLSLLRKDGQQAEHLLDQIARSGRLSAENMRFLKVHTLGSLERWRELSQLPHLPELLRARRPREVTEMLLRMVWWTELAPRLASGSAARSAAEAADLEGRFGAILHTIDVPTDAASRGVALLASILTDDEERVVRLTKAAVDPAERALQQRLLELKPAEPPAAVVTGLRDLLAQGRYAAVVESFLAEPRPADAEITVEAVLEMQDAGAGAKVLELVDAYVHAGGLALSRRLTRDVQELRGLVSDSCSGWLEWAQRIASDEKWVGADRVAREEHGNWPPPATFGLDEVATLADDVLTGWSGANQVQVAACLDLLCAVAARTTAAGHPTLGETVLLVLADQVSLTPVVREAYLDLLEQLLHRTPGSEHYSSLLEHATALWTRVESPSAVDWALALLDVLLEAPCPDDAARLQVAVVVLARFHEWSARLSLRQIVDANAIAAGFSMPGFTMPAIVDEEQRDIWERLNDKIVGLYSLLPRAAGDLSGRLSKLNASARVEANADTVATEALRGLAGRADHLIVDTWHAAHAATGAIDRVRPRERQILPRGRGSTGFLRALEEAIANA